MQASCIAAMVTVNENDELMMKTVAPTWTHENVRSATQSCIDSSVTDKNHSFSDG